jgi:transposase
VGDGGFHAYQSSSVRHWSERREVARQWLAQKGAQYEMTYGAVDKVGYLLKVIATEGTEPDCKWALELVASLDATYVLADKAYDSDDIIFSLSARGIVPIIPPKINRKFQRSYDKNIYKKRHIIENLFLKMKGWRSISTRYFKNIHSFVSTFRIRSISLFTA